MDAILSDHGNRTVTMTSEVTDAPSEYHYLTHTEIIIALIFIYTLDLVVIVGNGLVVVAFLRDTQLQVTRNYYIFNLAIADLLIGFFVVPFYSSTVITGTWPLGWPFCVVWNIVHNTTLLTSHLTIVFITFDRYLLVKDALEYHATEIPRKAIYRISITWVLVALVKTVLIIWGEWYFSQEGEEPSCSPRSRVEVPYIIGLQLYDVIFTTVCVTFEVFMPLALIAVVNIKVYRMIKKRHRGQSAVRDLVQRSLPSFQVRAQVTVHPNKATKGSGTSKKWAWQNHSLCLELCSCVRNCEWHKRTKVLPKDSWTDTQKDLEPIVEDVECKSESVEEVADHGGSATTQGAARSQESTDTAAGKPDAKAKSSLRARQLTIEETVAASMVPVTKQRMGQHNRALVSAAPVKAGGSPTPHHSTTKPPGPTAKLPGPTVKSPGPAVKSPATTASAQTSSAKPNPQWRRCSISLAPGILANVSPMADNDSISSVSSIINLDKVPEAHMPLPKKETPSRPDCKDSFPLLLRKPEPTAFIFPSAAVSDHPEAGAGVTVAENKEVQFKDTEAVTIRSSHNPVFIMSKVKKKQDNKARLTVTLYILFFICFKLPFGIILLVYAFCRDECIDDNLYEAFTWLYYAKSLVDPFLYAFICKRFRVYCVQMMAKIPGLKQCFKQGRGG